jgi:hypothetical protein
MDGPGATADSFMDAESIIAAKSEFFTATALARVSFSCF